MHESTGETDGRTGPRSEGPVVAASAPGADPVAELRGGLALQVCPYLAPGPAAAPLVGLTPARCMATPGDPWVLSDRQRTLVCLTEGYLDCPRYHRAADPDRIAPPVPGRRVPRATLVATLVLALSLGTAIGSMAMNGGIRTPVASLHPSPTDVPAGSAEPAPSGAVASTEPTPAVQTPVPSGADGPTPSATPGPAASASPRPTSDRYALLAACPGKPDCYTYTVRVGDNLTSIGLYFGVPFDTILRLNPWIRDPTTIRRGQVIVLPPPTR